MPGPPDVYLEFEACRFWGYRLSEWEEESHIKRAKMQAHFLHVRMREGYAMEVSSKEGGKSSDAERLNALMAAMPNNSAIEVVSRPKKIAK